MTAPVRSVFCKSNFSDNGSNIFGECLFCYLPPAPPSDLQQAPEACCAHKAETLDEAPAFGLGVERDKIGP